MSYIDETEVRKAIACIKPNNDLFEVRIISSNWKNPVSGYFKSAEVLLENLKRQDLNNANVYIVLNAINEACYSRDQRDKFISGKTSTSDNDIVGRDWILVDLDPVRPKGTSSTDEQIIKAKEKCLSVRKFLHEQGFTKPIVAFSGNGYHLLYKIAMKPTDETRDLLKQFLEALDELFSDDDINIDRVNFNAARVCKLYGTMAQKGMNTEDRPHRMSRILTVPEEIKPVDIAYIKKICKLVEHEQIKPSKYNNYNPRNFELSKWLTEHGISYRETSYAGGTKYYLDHCPFDENHKGKDAAIFQMSSGAIGFHCFHNSCADKQWRDVRLLFEPDAYTEKWKDEEQKAYRTFNREKPKPTIQPVDGKPVFMTAWDIIHLPKEPESFIKTGIKEIDKKIRGLRKGYVSVWSGLRSSAKSTLLSQICLNAVDEGNNVLMYSGEMKNTRVMEWMMQQAAGKNYVEPGKWENQYNVPFKYQEMIAKWMAKRLIIYTNDYGNNFIAFKDQLLKNIDSQKSDFVFLDNLMAFNIDDLADDKWTAQKEFTWSLHEIALQKNIHIAFVAHPRKAMGFLRFDDISGSADIGNMVDNAFIVHRNNDDFKRLFLSMYRNRQDVVDDGTNIVEIVKDRDYGTQDVFVPLYYEIESKRLKNDKAENKIYGWVEKPKKEDGFVETEDNPFV